jgi:SAM-dependent methyltransferase
MLLSYNEPSVRAAEFIATQTGDVSQVLRQLRELPIDDFGLLLLSLPDRRYPQLSKLLPRMASPDVQRGWTGADGYFLLKQTLTFARMLSHNFQLITGSSLNGCSIFDYGCGWGRIIRLMYYFVDPNMIYACDPWDKSIALCEGDGVLANLAISDYLPRILPFEGRKFRVIYAFSVFTHLSERAMSIAMRSLQRVLADDGVLAITVRPQEYWSYDPAVPEAEGATLAQTHASHGFAFRPHNRESVEGEVTYGDTSISLDYIRNKFGELQLAKIERSIDDPYQVILFLTKRRS